MVLKQWTNAVIGVIDKKLERFDPKWQAANGKGGLRSRSCADTYSTSE